MSSRTRLSVMPLSVLLPRMGEISGLHRLSASFENHLAELQEERLAGESEDGDDEERRASEESMLNQVLQWLSVESNWK